MLAMLAMALGAALAAGCGASLNAVPLDTQSADLVKVAGEWKGSFAREENTLYGTIDMRFEVGRHSADAQVKVHDVSEDGAPLRLDVARLKLKNGRLTGTIASYRDASCNCTVETEFVGEVWENVIMGTYIARTSAGGRSSGSWAAQRIDE